jgi:16S rRNA (adenine1518-N6/adenine1519-N6)-dimethyltransferase
LKFNYASEASKLLITNYARASEQVTRMFDLSDSKIVRMLCQKYGVSPTKERSQNFLVDKKALGTIVETATLSKKDTVLEIGPGMGVLTIELARRAGRVIAVDVDSKMIKILEEILSGFKNVELIHQNILRTNLGDLGVKKYKVVSNIPYKITTLILEKFLIKEAPPELMVLLLQKEMAERITAKVPDMNFLAVFVQFFGNVKIIARVPRHCFYPQPRIDSAIIEDKPNNKYSKILKSYGIEREKFFKFVHKGFSSPRKQLQNNLRYSLGLPKEEVLKVLEKLKLEPGVRAEELSIGDWLELARFIQIK